MINSSIKKTHIWQTIVVGFLCATIFFVGPVGQVFAQSTSVPITPTGAAAGGPPSAFFAAISSPIQFIVYIFTVVLPTYFAFAASLAFAMAVHLSLSGGSYAMNFVSAGWTTARDVANMAFIFILVYLSILLIINQGGDTAKTLTRVIFVALIINFSFFGTRVIVDLGNIAAVQIYNVMPNSDPESASVLANMGAKDLSQSIMTAIGVQNLLSVQGFSGMTESIKSTGTESNFIPYAVFISLGILITVIGTSLFVASVHFIERMVMLWFLIIASPLALIAYAAPEGVGVGKYFKSWYSTLIQTAFYPFFFLGVFLLVIIFMSSMFPAAAGVNGGFIGSVVAGSKATSEPWASLALLLAKMTILTTIAVIGIQKALAFAEDMGKATGKRAEAFGNFLQGSVVGRYKSILKRGGYKYTVGMAAYSAEKGLGSIGVRPSTMVRTKLTGYAKYQPKVSVMGVGMGGKPIEVKPIGKSFFDTMAKSKTLKDEKEKITNEAEVARKKKDTLDMLAYAAKDPVGFASNPNNRALLHKINTDNLFDSTKTTKEKQAVTDLLLKVAPHLSPEQIDKINKNEKDKLTPEVKQSIIDAHNRQYKDSAEAVANNRGELYDAAGIKIAEKGKLTDEEIKALHNMGETVIAELATSKKLEGLAEYLTDKQLGIIDKSDKIEDSLKHRIHVKKDTKALETLNSSLVVPTNSGIVVNRTVTDALASIHTSGNFIDAADISKVLTEIKNEGVELKKEMEKLKKEMDDTSKTQDERDASARKYEDMPRIMATLYVAIKHVGALKKTLDKSGGGIVVP